MKNVVYYSGYILFTSYIVPFISPLDLNHIDSNYYRAIIDKIIDPPKVFWISSITIESSREIYPCCYHYD